MSLLPAIRESQAVRFVDVIYRQRGKIHQQLHDVEVADPIVPAALLVKLARIAAAVRPAGYTTKERVLAVPETKAFISRSLNILSMGSRAIPVNTSAPPIGRAL